MLILIFLLALVSILVAILVLSSIASIASLRELPASLISVVVAILGCYRRVTADLWTIIHVRGVSIHSLETSVGSSIGILRCRVITNSLSRYSGISKSSISLRQIGYVMVSMIWLI